MRYLALLGALLTAVAACAGSAGPSGTPTAIATPISSAIATAVATDSASGEAAPVETVKEGRFELELSLAKATYRGADAITGRAALSVTGGKAAVIGGSGGGPLAFSYDEVGGTRHMDAGWDSSCGSFTIEPGAPITSALTKSGAWGAHDPNAAFYRAFFADREVHLPAGTWDVSARASFSEGNCSGPSHDMTATLRIVVGP